MNYKYFLILTVIILFFKACTECRKAKTRCNYIHNGTSCFRCENLALKCSLSEIVKEKTVSKFQKEAEIKKDSPLTTVNSTTRKVKVEDKNGVTSRQMVHRKDPTVRDLSGVILQFQKLNEDHFKLIETTMQKLSGKLEQIVDQKKSSNNDETLLGLDATKTFDDVPESKVDLNNVHLNFLESLQIHPSQAFDAATNGQATFVDGISQNAKGSGILNLANNEDIDSGQNSPNGSTPIPEFDPDFFGSSPFSGLETISQRLQMPHSFFKNNSLIEGRTIYTSMDVISRNILEYDTCMKLLDSCFVHYRRFLMENIGDIGHWLNEIRVKCPLLLSIYVLLGLRHSRPASQPNFNLELSILDDLNQLLSLFRSDTSKSILFLESISLLAQFAITLSYQQIHFDGWLLTSDGLTKFFDFCANTVFFENGELNYEKGQKLHILSNLLYTHMSYCIICGKPCMMDSKLLHRCLDLMETNAAAFDNNFTIGNINLLVTTYECIRSKKNLQNSLAQVDATFSKWYKADLGKEMPLFIIQFKFCRVMMIRKFLLGTNSKDDDVYYKSVEAEMINSVSEITTLANKIDINFLITFSDTEFMAVFMSTFVILQLRKGGYFDAVHDGLIMKISANFLQCCVSISNQNVYYFNGLIHAMITIIDHMNKVIFSENSQR